MSKFEGPIDRRELELVTREAELNRYEARLRRLAEERVTAMDAREVQLNRRETALGSLACELAAERERLTQARAELLEELRRLEVRQRQATPRWFAAPAATESTEHEDGWWAKVLGREQPTR
jgi:hypothetical protein